MCQPTLNSPSNAGMTQPSCLIVVSSVGNSVVGNSVDISQLKLPAVIQTSSPAEMSCNSSVVASSSTVCRQTSYSSSALTSVNASCVNRQLVLQSAGLQSTPPRLLLLSVTPLERVVVAEHPTSTVRYVVPTPVLQPISLQPPPSNSALVCKGNCIQTLSSPAGNLPGNPVRMSSSLGNTVVELSSSGCSPVGNSPTFVVQPQLGNLPPAVGRQSSLDCLLVGNSRSSDIAGIPASTVIEAGSGNPRPDVVQQSTLYYVVMGSSDMQASLVNSTLPPQTLTLAETMSTGTQPQRLSSTTTFLTNTTSTQPQRPCSTSTTFLSTAQ